MKLDKELMHVAERAVAREVFQRTVVETLLGNLRGSVESLRADNTAPSRVMADIAEEFITHVEGFK